MSWLYTVVFAGLMLSSQGARSQPVATAVGQRVVIQAQDETERFEQTYPIAANGRVKVSNVNGSIVIEAWDRNEVKLEYAKVADSKERLAQVDVKIESRGDYFSAEANYDNWQRDKSNDNSRTSRLDIEFRLMVPRGAVLNEIETVNGSVTAANFANFTKISTVNGSVTATNLRGTAKLSTVNGEVAASFDRLDTDSKINLDTVNGRVNLTLPSDANATIRADSLNGNITNDFGLPVRKGKYVGRDLYGKLGSGDIQIKLDSVNGTLAIGRRNDGKPLSPAVNLLPQKAKDDDWDNDEKNDLATASAKLNQDIARSMRESQKVTANALADARVEISKLDPEIAKIAAASIERSAESAANAAEILRSGRVREQIEMANRDLITRALNVGFTGGATRIEKKSGTIVVKGVPTVIVDAEPCSVKVTGWDKNEVAYRVVQYNQPRRSMPLEVTETHTDSTVNLSVKDTDNYNPGRRFYGDGSETRIEVYVPRKSNLKVTTNGEFRVEGVTGDIVLKGSNESINVRDVEGKLRVTSFSGTIRVIGFKGELDAESFDGTLSLEGDFKKLTAKAHEGEINLTLLDNTSADLDATCNKLLEDGVQLIRLSKEDDERGRYRIGNGGPQFKIETRGDIHIRGAASLSETN